VTCESASGYFELKCVCGGVEPTFSGLVWFIVVYAASHVRRCDVCMPFDTSERPR